ncbi:MAG: hypothetical protein ACJATA_002206 [Sphingobacteriales bacterium]|jgi:hypothetical protein
MKKSKLFFILLILISSNLVAQNNSKIFDASKVFVYDAFFIEKNGDTLTKEILRMKGNDKPWVLQSKKQTELEILYEPDSINLEKFIHPYQAERNRISKGKSNRIKGKRGWDNYTWIDKSEITGYVENDSLIWLHPPRHNQYKYAYLSAYPEVRLKELKIGGHWKNLLLIRRGYPSNKEFVGNVINDFKVIGVVSDSVGGKSIANCWKIESIDTHSKLGESHSTFIFDEKYYGFIKMEFEYYNGIKIIFRLKEVIKEE